MAIQDVIRLLGQDVTFIEESREIGLDVLEGFYRVITGSVSAIVIHEDLSLCEVLVNEDYYPIASITFIEELPSPL